MLCIWLVMKEKHVRDVLFYYFFFTASSVQSVSDENLSLVDIENLLVERVKDKKEDLKAAFEAFDLEGNKAVTKGEFRRVIEGFLLPLTESQFEGLLAKVCSFTKVTHFLQCTYCIVYIVIYISCVFFSYYMFNIFIHLNFINIPLLD